MNALDIIQRFARAVGFPVPSTALANQADDVQQIVELLNQEGRSLRDRTNWQALSYEATFTTLATEVQGTLASIIGATQVLDFIIDDTIWNRTTQVPIPGPVSKQKWQAKKALVLTGPYSSYRLRNDRIIFYPSPTAGHTCYFEYQSLCWCTDVSGVTFRTNLSADTDIMLLDDEVMLAGLEWRWLRKKGLSYAEEFASYEALVDDRIQSDGTKPTLDASGGEREPRPGVFVPVGSWNL